MDVLSRIHHAIRIQLIQKPRIGRNFKCFIAECYLTEGIGSQSALLIKIKRETVSVEFELIRVFFLFGEGKNVVNPQLFGNHADHILFQRLLQNRFRNPLLQLYYIRGGSYILQIRIDQRVFLPTKPDFWHGTIQFLNKLQI